MTTDAGSPKRRSLRDLASLPDVLNLEIRYRTFDPPRRVTNKGVDRVVKDAVEFEVTVSKRFTIRALGPALWVGDHALTAAETSDGLTYRFFSFEPKAMAADAPISLGWTSSSEPRKQTKFLFRMPPGAK